MKIPLYFSVICSLSLWLWHCFLRIIMNLNWFLLSPEEFNSQAVWSEYILSSGLQWRFYVGSGQCRFKIIYRTLQNGTCINPLMALPQPAIVQVVQASTQECKKKSCLYMSPQRTLKGIYVVTHSNILGDFSFFSSILFTCFFEYFICEFIPSSPHLTHSTLYTKHFLSRDDKELSTFSFFTHT